MIRPSVSVVCDVVAPYPEGSNFRQYFCTIIAYGLVEFVLDMHELEK